VAKIFGPALLQPARSICVSLNAFFITIASRRLCNLFITDVMLDIVQELSRCGKT